METDLSEQFTVLDKLFDSLPEYSDRKFGRHYRMSEGKFVVWLFPPSPITKFLLCSNNVATY